MKKIMIVDETAKLMKAIAWMPTDRASHVPNLTLNNHFQIQRGKFSGKDDSRIS
jgi:hypothetical protein